MFEYEEVPFMARVAGVVGGGLLTRVAYFMCRRKVGKVVTPLTITAHHPRLLRAYAHMEMGQEAARTVDARLKMLASIKAAMLIGCPF